MSGETTVFLAGALADHLLRRIVLGRDVAGRQARVRNHAVVLDPKTGSTPLVRLDSGHADGLLMTDLLPEDAARLAFYAAVTGDAVQQGLVNGDVGPIQATVLVVRDAAAGLLPYDPAEWAAVWAPTLRATAGDVMALFPTGAVERIAARYGMMLVRGASRVRAAGAGATTLRHQAGAGDVQIARRGAPYAAFFAVEEYDIAWRRFRGDISPPARRAVFVAGDAVTVLPYDPVRDRVLLIEQFRVGPMARGDAQPWLLEPIAGRIDAGETPQAAARREAVEEAGLTLGALLPVAQYYPTPGANSEYLYSYVAICDLPDDATGIFGLASEAEDIRSHLVPFDAFMALVASGEVANAPLILTALWLQRERAALRPQSVSGS